MGDLDLADDTDILSHSTNQAKDRLDLATTSRMKGLNIKK